MSATMVAPLQIGRNVSLFSFSPESSSSLGVLTDGTAVSLLGKFREADFQFSNNLIDIHSADASMANYLVTTGDFTVTVSEIIPANGNSLIMTQFFAGQFVSLTAQMTGFGGGAAGKTITLYGVLERAGRNLAEGENIATMVIRPCSVPPTFA